MGHEASLLNIENVTRLAALLQMPPSAGNSYRIQGDNSNYYSSADGTNSQGDDRTEASSAAAVDRHFSQRAPGACWLAFPSSRLVAALVE